MSLVNSMKSMVTSVLRIGKVLVPVLRSLGDLVPEIGNLFKSVDEQIAAGGVEADKFLDRNKDTIIETREVFRDLQTFGSEGEKLCDKLILASQDDTVTPEDGESILAQSQVVASALADVVRNNSALIPKLEAMK